MVKKRKEKNRTENWRMTQDSKEIDEMEMILTLSNSVICLSVTLS